MRAILSSLIAAAILGAAGCRPESLPPEPTTSVRFITGVAGGSFSEIGDVLTGEFRRVRPTLRVEALAGLGAVANVEALEDGSADVGLAFADVVYLAASGQLARRPQRFEQLSAIAVIHLTPLHVVVSGRESLTNVAELRERVGIAGAAVTGSALAARQALATLGVSVPASQIVSLRLGRVAQQLQDGSLSAIILLATDPVDWVQDALDRGARILPLSRHQIQQLNTTFPFFKPALISASHYRGMTQSVETVGVESLLVCRRGLDEGVVYELTKRLIEAIPALSERFGAGFMELETAPATSIPLHPGARRYYRERELLR